MPTRTTTLDLWVGVTTVSTSIDMLVQRSPTLTTDLDMYVGHILETSVDMFVVDTRGTFRGSGSEADRDALEAVQPGDVFIVTDP